MESQPQNPEFRKNLENFHPCNCLNAGELGMLFLSSDFFSKEYHQRVKKL